MIDPHIHLRDGPKQKHKETVYHGLKVAYKAGLDGVIEMPNTSPPLDNESEIKKRIDLQDKEISKLNSEGIDIYCGMHALISKVESSHINDIVKIQNDLKNRVLGIKIFVGESTGGFAIYDPMDQSNVYKILTASGFEGTLVIHCEDEKYMKRDLWNFEDPITHSKARPIKAETYSVEQQINYAVESRFKGRIHIAHASAPETVYIIEEAKKNYGLNITCEVTPHHCVLNAEMMNKENGLDLKMNPPLRSQSYANQLLDILTTKDLIAYIGTDHAPHLLEEKRGAKAASGIPGLPFYPVFVKVLDELVNPERVEDLTHNNIVKMYGLNPDLIKNTNRRINDREIKELAKEYQFNAFRHVI